MDGPIVGELYWEGYLQAFGLRPEEFPVSSAQVAVEAYKAMLHGAIALILDLWRLKWWVGLPLLVGSIVAISSRAEPVLSQWIRFRRWLGSALEDRSAVGASLHATTNTLVLLASLTVAVYFAVAALVVIVSPMNARTFGL